jgi:hypothetical protein
MIAGAIAFFVYAGCASLIIKRVKVSASLVTLALLPLWGGAAFVIWWAWLR